MRKLACFTFGFAAAIFLTMYALGGNVIVLAALAGTITVLLSFSYLKKYAAVTLTMFSVFAGFLWWMVYNACFYDPAVALRDTDTTEVFTVLDYPEHYEYSSRVYARTGSGYRVNLRLDSRMDLKPGDRLTLEVSFSQPEETRDFDFLTYYRAKGIFLDAVQKGPVTAERCKRIPLALLPAAIRHSINDKLGALFSGDEQGLISALLTGNRSGISQSFQFSLSGAGMSHIISVSGMHVSFLAGLILTIFGKRKAAALAAIPAMLFFVMMTGAAPSAVRAFVMQTMVFISALTGREADALTSLSAALLILLIINPFSIADIGLQLSFLSTAGMILFSPQVSRWLTDRLPKRVRRNFMVRLALGTISASFSATILTFLPVMIYFGRLSLIAPLSNLFSLWMVTAVFFGGIACVLLSFVFMPAARIVAIPLKIGLKYIKLVADASIRIPYSSLNAKDPYIVIWLIFACIVFAIWIFGEMKRKNTAVASCLIASALVFSFFVAEIERSSNDLVINVLDVGQGQSIAVTSGAYTALIDCGGDRWPGAGNIAVEHLYSRNKRKVDLLLLTHTHADHVNGLEDLMEHVRIKSAAVPATEACREIAGLLGERGVDVIPVSENTIVEFGKCTIKLFRPIVKKSGEEESMCILISKGDFDILITGDSAVISERILIEREELPDIELLVAGHHGSGGSTGNRLLDTVTPEAAVISVGADNRYGHPSPDTITKLEDRGIHIYRTDLQGEIEITVKG